ncbi:MAG TPA: cytochrome c biogenesis heme-transporting ATPase CcmA [Zoogloea sp.]|uniref:cytochrome c biogenesis heme-transporting ATPase CcmA n=1 Tax=Zoogloea sp. TaxID=49181 RepID=UPI002CEB2A1F|nr:cytochrome c biogenesis heme-transporting ATPase CcmA [Zoogloea sp.]HMV18598.1 cytochrome c biogenesis heme-transporting ATPase CcmA [Rhodocyclaceae bacterium]HMV63989.1 cytochrome c biogenesis heme-transporting ATPase CcmA [Rhodocyclaceae bacterium]HMW53281.1 cytochrome c biogenesis heme-transporting ATPase CcmA [Rhodocyclaceae bacterium]HMZ74856.1 cytochrome c biogenesis heme-transporting ATPase CcmA [Rhodocyclaceae bacterium]HNB64507.1 cytochrome c biogenesis heme-transporting ATPase Ccm
MLRAHGLACDRGDRRLFSGVDCAVAPGEWLQVEGPNGAGKTSLLRILAGLAPAAAGHIEWEGRPVADVRDEYHARLLYLGHAPSIKDDLSALENLTIAAAVAGRPLDEAAALGALRRIGLKGREDLPSRVLSQGQKRRVALARLLCSQARLWILDEPFVALDVAAVDQLCAILDDHLGRGGMLLFTSHQAVQLSGAGGSLRLGA